MFPPSFYARFWCTDSHHRRQFLFDDFVATLSGARRFLYIEHQYPFQNYALTHCMCEALRNNPDLLLVIITPVATDLPSGPLPLLRQNGVCVCVRDMVG